MRRGTRFLAWVLLFISIEGKAMPADSIETVITGETGPWLVFIHGGFADMTSWIPQVADLCSDFRCMQVDLRGHGRSAHLPAPYDQPTLGADVAREMGAHDVQHAVLIGHSMGVRVAVETFHRVPDRTAGIIFLDGSLLSEGDPELAGKAIEQQVDEQGIETVLDSLYGSHFSSHFDPALKAKILGSAHATARRIGSELLHGLFYYDAGSFRDRAAQVTVPVLAISTTIASDGGSRRRALRAGETSTPYLQEIESILPLIEKQVIADSGHFAQFESTTLLNGSIRAFAREIASP